MATLPPEQTADDKLAGLLERLARCRVAGDPERGQAYADARRLVEAQIALLPLVHGIDRIEHVAQVVADRELRSRTRLGRLPSATEAYLGLADQVYTAIHRRGCSLLQQDSGHSALACGRGVCGSLGDALGYRGFLQASLPRIARSTRS